MNYPIISKYAETIKLTEGNRDQLSHLRPVLYDDEILEISSGNFA